jgi:hypothetical protein
LREFQAAGWLLVDATYKPVNGIKSESARDDTINGDYKLLVSDLKRFPPAPLILIKANVCRLLKQRLADDGFGVLNKDDVDDPPFPSHWRAREFAKKFTAILNAAGLAPARRRRKIVHNTRR